MIAYKFLPKEFAPDAARGRFKISLLTFFNRTEDRSIRDEDDGKTVGFTDRPFVIDENPENAVLRERMERYGWIKVSNGGKVISSGASSRYEMTLPPAYILSLSSDINCPKWLTGDEPKDAVVKIRGLRILANAVAQRHADILGPALVRRVIYTQRRVDLLQRDLDPLSAFHKRPAFSDEAEIRIIFMAKATSPAEWFITECDGLENILSWEMRPQLA